MNVYEDEVIVEKIKELFGGNVEVRKYGENGHVIKVEQMYHYVEVNLAKLLVMAEFFGTTNITVDEEYFNGCDTCDYGSSYIKEFYVRDPE